MPVLAERDVERIAAVRKEQRIVGRCVDLALRDFARVSNRIATRAVNLWRAPQRIRILHRARAFYQLRSCEQLANSRRTLNLPKLAARFMHFRIERARAAAHRFERHRCGGVRNACDSLRVVDSEGEHRGRKIRAVHQRQAFLETRQQLLGTEAENRRKLLRIAQRRIGRRVEASLSEQHDEEVRERTEIAARSNRTAQRNERNDAAIQHRLHDVHELAPHAGMSLQKRIQPRRQRGPHNFGAEVIRDIVGIRVVADADRMTEQQIALQLFELVRRDRLVFEFAEAGGDAVLGRRRFAGFIRASIVFDDLRDQLLGTRNDGLRRRIALDENRWIARDGDQLLDRQRRAIERDRGHGRSIFRIVSISSARGVVT